MRHPDPDASRTLWLRGIGRIENCGILRPPPLYGPVRQLMMDGHLYAITLERMGLTMKLQRLGGDSTDGQSPTLFRSDKPSYIVQGWSTEFVDTIEIPHRLIRYLQPGTCLGTVLRDTGHGTFMLTGKPVTDSEALQQIRLPRHESAIEVTIGTEIRRDAAPAV